MEQVLEKMHYLSERMAAVEAVLRTFVERATVKDWYTTADIATILGKAEFTVREWARLRRIRAEKRNSGRGPFPSWVISHGELLRYQREGLLPVRGNVVA